VAVGLSLLGVHATLVAMVGEDEGGERIRSFLDERGVILVASPAELGTSRALSRRVDGEPTYEFNEAARSRRISFDQRTRSAIDEAELVIVSSFPFDDADQAAALRESVDAPGRRLMVDVNPRAGMLRDRESFVREFEETARLSALVKIGDEDAHLLYGDSLQRVAARLLAMGARTIFATAGAGGATLMSRSGLALTRPIVDLPGEIVDTMGAGDATLASLTSSILMANGDPTDEQWARALDQAMLLAAATCRVRGATLQLPPPVRPD
jgi:fructokinase